MFSWEILESACKTCNRCRLAENRTNVVVGGGNRKAKILLIGEGPGEKEDLSGVPFVGPAGQLLDKMLACIDLSRNDVYIANVVKCRPPGNRSRARRKKLLYRVFKIPVCSNKTTDYCMFRKNSSSVYYRF